MALKASNMKTSTCTVNNILISGLRMSSFRSEVKENSFALTHNHMHARTNLKFRSAALINAIAW